MRLSNLLGHGSSSRWLLRETLVVVLGVLIALGLDDYWTFRQERLLEVQYLKRIHDDIGADIELIDQFGKRLLERKIGALNTIAPVVRRQAPVPDDVETFLRAVSLGALGGASPTNWTTDTTFADLKSTGNLRLIRNTELRRKISQYYKEFEEFHTRTRDRKTKYAKAVWSVMPGELRENMTFADMKEFGIDRAIKLFTSSEFESLMDQEYNYAFFNQRIDSSSAKLLRRELEEYIEYLEN